MTRKELEKALKGASEEEIRVLAESVAVAPTLELLNTLLGNLRKNYMWNIFPSALGTTLAMFIMQSVENRLGFFHHPLEVSFESLSTVLLVQICMYLLLPKAAILFRQPIWKNSRQLFVKLARRAAGEDSGVLCSTLWELRGSLSPGWNAEMDEIVTPLLLYLDDEEAQKLPENAKRWIRWRLKLDASPELRIAGLLALASSGDVRLAPVAKKLQNASDERVRAAAAEALRIMENRR